MTHRFDQIPKANPGTGPKVRSSAAVLRLKFIAVFGSLLAAAVCGVVAVVIAVGAASRPFPEPPAEPVAKGFTTIVASDFLRAHCTDLPVAEDVDPCFGVLASSGPDDSGPDDSDDGEEDEGGPLNPDEELAVGPVSVDANGVGGLPVQGWSWLSFDRGYVEDLALHYETHRFLVTIGPDTPGVDTQRATGGETSKVYELAITVTLTEAGPIVSAAPTLLPLAPRTSTVERFDWTVYGTEVPAAVLGRVEEWAAAYASDDGAALSSLADDSSGGSYNGIGGAEVLDVDVSGGAIEGSDGDMVVRARVSFRRANGFIWQTEFDLLITQATGAQPKVVAWGPAGSAMTLRPYMNSVQTS